MQAGRELESFKDALKREHLARIERLEKERDERITGMVADGRMAVQKKVSALRKDQEARFNRLAEEKKKEGWSLARAAFLEEFSELSRWSEGELEKKVSELKSSDRARYGASLAALAREALASCGRPAVLVVETGCGEIIRETLGKEGLLLDVEVREENIDGWGGCRAETENEIIDNTLLARWGRMKTVFSLKLSRLANDSFTEIRRRINKL